VHSGERGVANSRRCNVCIPKYDDVIAGRALCRGKTPSLASRDCSVAGSPSLAGSLRVEDKRTPTNAQGCIID
jgi:hypothetical protein